MARWVSAPHQPRLDWQMWFAALGTFHQNPWFISFAHRLLLDEPSVLHLISDNPFKSRPPEFIRAHLYLYHYTPFDQADRRYSNTSWWWREFKSDYLYPIDKQGLKKYLESRNLLPAKV